MSFFLIAVDPGDSCGYVAVLDGVRVGFGQGPPSEMIAQVANHLMNYKRRQHCETFMAIERYTIDQRSARHSAQPTALQVTGELKREAHLLGVPVTTQDVGSAKKIAPNVLLRRLGWYLSGDDVGCPDANDANDAARHALLWLAAHRATAFDSLMKQLS